MNKNIFLFSLVIFSIAILGVIASTQSSIDKKCVQNCNSIADNLSKICKNNYNNEIDNCKSYFLLCNDSRKNCIKNFSTCNKIATKDVVDCRNNVSLIQKTCKNSCVICNNITNSVCGKDGKTYNNQCEMNKAGVEKKYNGICASNNCSILSNEINSQINLSRVCNSDNDCEFGYLGTPCSFNRCGAAFNKNFKLDILNNLSTSFENYCHPICPMYMCVNPNVFSAKCENKVCVAVDKPTQSCVSEGGTIPVILNAPKCCDGLTLIKPKETTIIGISGICTTKCGDGVCDNSTETNYNCPADCKISNNQNVTLCKKNSDCPVIPGCPSPNAICKKYYCDVDSVCRINYGGACTALGDPVCGVDGKTFGNPCTMRNLGVPKACDGACPCKG